MRLDVMLAETRARYEAAEKLLKSRLHAMRDDMGGQPRAQSYDTSRGQASAWCWTHERDVDACHEATPPLPCAGEHITVHDLTGEAAIERAAGHDHAANAQRELSRIIRRAERDSLRLTDLLASWGSAVLTIDRAGIGVCDGCRRYCDGHKDNRLRPLGDKRVCNRCRMAHQRAS